MKNPPGIPENPYKLYPIDLFEDFNGHEVSMPHVNFFGFKEVGGAFYKAILIETEEPDSDLSLNFWVLRLELKDARILGAGVRALRLDPMEPWDEFIDLRHEFITMLEHNLPLAWAKAEVVSEAGGKALREYARIIAKPFGPADACNISGRGSQLSKIDTRMPGRKIIPLPPDDASIHAQNKDLIERKLGMLRSCLLTKMHPRQKP